MRKDTISKCLLSLLFVGFTFSFSFAQLIDANVKSVTVPEPKFGMSENETVSVEIQNSGTQTLTELPVLVTLHSPVGTVVVAETISSSLAPGETIHHTFSEKFDLTHSGVYEISVEVDLEEDENDENNYGIGETLKLSRYEGGFPFKEEFKADPLRTKVLTNHEDLPGFNFYTFTEENYLSLHKDPYDLSCDATLSAKEGTESTLIYTLDLSEQEDDIRDFYLDFMLGERLSTFGEVLIRGSEEEEWIEILENHKVANAQYDSNQYLNTHYLNLTEILHEGGQKFSSTTQIIFRIPAIDMGYSQQHFFSLQYIHFYHQEAKEVSIEVYDRYHISQLNDEKINLRIQNHGKYAISNIPLTIELYGPNGKTVYNHVINEEILHGWGITKEFSIEMNSGGIYDIKAYTSLEGDGYRNNDTSRIEVGIPKVYSGLFPYEQDFDDLEELHIEGLTTDIDLLPGFTFISKNGILKTTYDSASNSRVLSVNMKEKVGDPSDTDLVFTADMSTLQNMDSLIIEFDYNVSCSELFYRGSVNDEWLHIILKDGCVCGMELFKFDVLDSLRQNGQELSSTFQIAFSKHKQIDNFKIRPVVSQDIALRKLIIPGSRTNWTSTEVLKIELNNNGQLIEKEFPLVIEVTDPTKTIVYREKISSSVNPGESVVVNMNSTFDLSEYDIYSFKAYLDLENNLAKDTLYAVIENKLILNVDHASTNNQFKIYPNPSNGVLYYTANEDVVEEINLYSSSGILLTSFKAGSGKVNLMNYEPGNYFIQFKTSKELIYRQLILK